MSKRILRLCYIGALGVVAFMMVVILKKEQNILQASYRLSGEGTVEHPFLIQNEEDYIAFAQAVNVDKKHYTNQYIMITQDLDFSKINAMVGVAQSEESEDEEKTYFEGFLDGAGHKISNVNILEEDGKAGLFVNLNGVIANLQVESGTIYGKKTGAITASVYNHAKVLNCCNKATILGDTEDGMVDGFVGEQENCYSLNSEENQDGDPQEIVDRMNAYLDTISINESYHNWCQWEVVDGAVTLTDRYRPVLNAIKTDIHIGGNVVTMEAFSSYDGNWYFSFPSGYQEERLTISTIFQDGEIIKSELEIGEDEKIVSYDNKDYHIICKVNENTPSIFLSTEVDKGIQYMASTKLNLTRGGISVLNEDGSVFYSGIVNEMSGRGNDSFLRSKKIGYNLNLRERIDLLGLGENEDFVLISGYRDNSLLTYKITQDMEKGAGVDFAPESRFVSLYIDNHYVGMYLLTEKNEIDKNRYDISDVKLRTQQLTNRELYSYHLESDDNKTWYDIPRNPDDITGGYLLEIDNSDYTEDQSRFQSNRDIIVTLKSDKYATKEQVEYLDDYWQDFEDAVFAEDGYNDKGIYYTEYIDLKSFADQWLMYEINSEVSMMSSVYLYKESEVDGDGLLHAGYVWDVEHSFDNSPTMLNIAGRQYTNLSGYWVALYKHPEFAQMVLEEWNTRFEPAIAGLLMDDQIMRADGLSTMNWYQQQYAVSAGINGLRWAESDWNQKVDIIREHLTLKKDFLSQALPMYDSGYDYLEVKEDGILYGVNHVWAEDGTSVTADDVFKEIR